MEEIQKITDIPENDRPREKLELAGSSSLSERELLAVLLGSGPQGGGVMATAQRLLGKYKNIRNLARASVEDLKKIRGIGPVKAIQLKATLEFARRAYDPEYSIPQPFLKWVGGKSQLLEQYSELFPINFNTYHEPFLGGGAVYFHLKPKKAILSDLNENLIQAYVSVKLQPKKLMSALGELQLKHSESFFYEVRKRYNGNEFNEIDKSAAFIYLNKTGYNGLYRENAKGELNVPFGRQKSISIYDESNILSASKLLKGAKLLQSSFVTVLDRVKKGDFVYFDPPYLPISKTSNFTGYTKENFLIKEQEELAAVFRELDKKGCYVMLSNSASPVIKNMYKGFRIVTVTANRNINSLSSKRTPIDEIVILNY